MRSEWVQKCDAARVQDNETLGDLLRAGVTLMPDKPAVIFEEERLSFAELDQSVSQVAAGLAALGLKKGDHLAIHVDNRPEFVLTYLAVARMGGVLVPTNTMFTSKELEYVLKDSGAKALVILSQFKAKLEGLELPQLEHVIVVGEESFNGVASTDSSEWKRPTVSPGDLAVIQYTSGTTGHPKGAMLSHRNIVSQLDSALETRIGSSTDETNATLVVLPLFHIYALSIGLGVAFLGAGSVVLVNGFKPEKVFQQIEMHRATHFYGAPPMYFAFANTPGLEKYDVSSMQTVISGAAPLSMVILEKFEEVTGTAIQEAYGLTEASPLLTSNSAAPVNKPGSVGPACPGLTIRVVDANGSDVPIGEVGEVIAQGENIFMGYLNKPEATAETLREGWLYTGDLGKLDDEGYLTLVDRKKDMIIVSGYNVYPVEVENVLMRHPAVNDVSVIGVLDDYQGESVKAIMVQQPGVETNSNELEAYCREHLATYKIPKYFSFRDELPKSPTGKVLKRVLRDQESD